MVFATDHMPALCYAFYLATPQGSTQDIRVGLIPCKTILWCRRCYDCWLQAYLHGVLPVQKACFTSLQQNALRWSNRLTQAFAVCHSLNMVSKSDVAGVDMERTLFKAVEARFLVSNRCCKPCMYHAC